MVTPLVAVACAGAPTPPAAAPAPPAGEACEPAAEPGDGVVLWHPFVNDDTRRRALDAGLDAFRAAHPQIPVTSVPVEGDEIADQLGTASPRDPPDALLVADADLVRLADSGRVLPPRACLRAVAGPAPDSFRPAARRTWSVEGRLWAVPYAAEVPLLWFNRRRLDAVNRAVPASRDELTAILADLHAATGGAGLHYDLELAFVLVERWAAQRGAPLVGRDSRGRPRVHLDRPEVHDDLRWLADLDRRGLITSPDDENSSRDVEALAEPGMSAALAVHPSGFAGEAMLRMDRGDLDPGLGGLAAVPPPRPGPAPEPAPGGYGFVLVRGPRADGPGAARLASHLASPAAQAAMAASTGFAPVVAGAERELVLAEAIRRHPPLQAGLDAVAAADAAADAGVAPPRLGTYRDLRRTVIDAYRRLRRGEDLDLVLDEAQRDATRQVELYERVHGRG